MEKGYISPPPPVVQARVGSSSHLLLKSLAGLFVLVALVTLGAFYIQLLKTVYDLRAELESTRLELTDVFDQLEEHDGRLHVHDVKFTTLDNHTDTINKRIVDAFTTQTKVGNILVRAQNTSSHFKILKAKSITN